MPIYRVRMEEVETEKRTEVSYATFHVDSNDDPLRVFRQLRRQRDGLKWVRAEDEDENDYDVEEEYDPPEFFADDDSVTEPPVRGKPSDYGLEQLALA